MKRKRIGVLVALLMALSLSLSVPAWAQSSATVSSAREIAKQGLDAFDAGNYKEASQKLLKAFEVVKVPTLAVHAARLLVKMGRLVEACDVCVDDHCYPEQASDVDAVNSLRTLSTTGFIAGGVIGAAGVTLLLTSPRDTGVTTALRVGVQSASLAGSF